MKELPAHIRANELRKGVCFKHGQLRNKSSNLSSPIRFRTHSRSASVDDSSSENSAADFKTVFTIQDSIDHRSSTTMLSPKMRQPRTSI